jgi:HNH endonuclease
MDAVALQTYNLHQNSPGTRTNFCHIFPPSTNWGFNNPNDPHGTKVNLFSFIVCFLSLNVLQKKYAGNVWAIISSFRSIDVLTQLNGNNIHSLENGFTMDMGLHSLFDDLQLWFEHIAVSG